MNLEYQDFTEAELVEAQQEAAQGNAGPLRLLCHKEAERFGELMRQHPNYRDGLVKIERMAVEGYLYQKFRGHLNATSTENHLPKERQDGAS